jgi:hypothetical protein
LSDCNENNNALKVNKQTTEKMSNPVIPAEDEDRRTGIERRYFSYSLHIPDKRSGIDRRNQLSMDIKVQS